MSRPATCPSHCKHPALYFRVDNDRHSFVDLGFFFHIDMTNPRSGLDHRDTFLSSTYYWIRNRSRAVSIRTTQRVAVKSSFTVSRPDGGNVTQSSIDASRPLTPS